MGTTNINMGTEIEALATGHFLAWHGLDPFPADSPPACLRPTGQSGWLPFSQTRLAFEVFRFQPCHSEVWLFRDEQGRICLVEIYGLSTGPSFTQLLDELSSPDLMGPVPLAAKLQRPTYLEGCDLVERVYVGRGMALATRKGTEGQLELVRVRGFQVMPAARYQERFVNLPATRFLEQQ